MGNCVQTKTCLIYERNPTQILTCHSDIVNLRILLNTCSHVVYIYVK